MPFGWLHSILLTPYFWWEYRFRFMPTFSGMQLECATRAGSTCILWTQLYRKYNHWLELQLPTVKIITKSKAWQMGIGVQFPAGTNILLFFAVSILAVGPIQPPTLHVPQAIRPTIKQLQSDTDQSAGPPKCRELTQCLHTKVPNQAEG
jgi:hypothetical protein